MPAPGVLSDVEESVMDVSGPSSFPNDFSLDSNLRSSSRNTSISGPTAPSSVPIQTPSPSGSSLARYAARRNNGPSGGKGLDTPLQPPVKVSSRGILSADDSIYSTSGKHATPKRPSRIGLDSGSDSPATAVKPERKPAKRSNAMMTLREHEKVPFIFYTWPFRVFN